MVAIYFYLLPFLPFFYLVTSNCFSPKAICFVRVLMTSRRKRSILIRYEHIKYMNQSRTFYSHVPVPIKELCKSCLCITPGFIRGKECRQGTKLFVLTIVSTINSAFLLVAIYFYLLPFLPFFYLVTSNCFSPKAICFILVLISSYRKQSF